MSKDKMRDATRLLDAAVRTAKPKYRYRLEEVSLHNIEDGGDFDAGPARAASRQSVESDALEHGMLLA